MLISNDTFREKSLFYTMIKNLLARYSITPPVTGLFITVFIIFAAIMFWSTLERQQSFMTSQIYFGEKAALNAHDAVKNALGNRRHFVKLFVEDNIEAIRALVKDPGNEELSQIIKKQLSRYIPDLFTINITNDQAELLISDFEGFTGNMCINDVHVFAESGQHLSRVHPNHILYHYDILERFDAGKKEYIFFASFGLNDISDALKHSSPTGHQLLLARDTEIAPLIEVTETGGRDTIKERTDFRLTENEASRVLSRTKIDGTHWSVLDVINHEQTDSYNRKLIKQNIIVVFIFTILLVVVWYFIVSKILTQNRKIHGLNDELKELLVIDGLTGLYNKGYLENQLHKEWFRALRDKKRITVMLIDIDHFKLYNDNYGHLQGDKCLQQVAAVIMETFQRENDFAARFGGEEFCVVLNDESAQSPEELISKAHDNLMEKNIPHKCSPTAGYVTFSIGVASLVPNHNVTPEWLMDRADKALYQAKHNGRNNTFFCDSEQCL